MARFLSVATTPKSTSGMVKLSRTKASLRTLTGAATGVARAAAGFAAAAFAAGAGFAGAATFTGAATLVDLMALVALVTLDKGAAGRAGRAVLEFGLRRGLALAMIRLLQLKTV